MTRNATDPLIIIGAGMAGLSAARLLEEAGQPVLLLDKARGVGGRMATRRLHNGRADHGAQYFTVRDQTFAQGVAEWQEAGLVGEWAHGFATTTEAGPANGYPRYRGMKGMTAVPKHLAETLDVRLQTRVSAVSQENKRWCVETQAGAAFSGRALLLTPPVPQSLALLEAGQVVLPQAIKEDLEQITYNPCLALVAVFAGPSRLPAPGGLRFAEGPIAWIADNHQKGISPGAQTITIHATPEYSEKHWRTNAIILASKLLDAASPWLDEEVIDWQIHRWRYSQPRTTYAGPALFLPGSPPLAFAGDAFGGANVEGAAVSGYAAARALLDALNA